MTDINIILTTYNSKNTIERAFNSIKNQKTKYKTKIIIIDDGSTDGTDTLINEYVKKYDNVISIIQSNNGVSSARNKGIELSNSKYIMFCDADDEYELDFIENSMNKMNDNNKLVIAGIKKILQNGTIQLEIKSEMKYATDNNDLIEYYLCDNKEMDVGPWAKLFNLKLIKDNNIKFENKQVFEDSLFLLKYLECINYNEIGYIEKPEYILYKRNGSITNSFDPNFKQKCDRYINDVKNIITKDNKLPDYFDSFKARTDLYFVHRSILMDPQWTTKEQHNILKNDCSVNIFQHLDKKYVFALLLANFLPSVYIKMYTRKFANEK